MIGIKQNLGLGDALAMSPIIAHIAQDNPFERIAIQAYPQNMESVKSIYVNHPNITVVGDNVPIDETYRFGWYSEIGIKPNEYFVDWFFRQYGKKREELPSVIKNASEQIFQVEVPEVFIHDKSEHRINLDGFRPSEGGSILRYVSGLIKATEIHVIDSAFLHLVEEIPVTGELYFHKYAREGSRDTTFNLKHKWNVID